MVAPMDTPGPAELAVDDLVDRLLRGERMDVEAFLAAHPELGPDDLARARKLARVLGGPAAPPPAAGGLPFERLGAYRLLERLGAGGMGIVFLAEDERLGRRVALKIVRPELAGSAETVARFEREARAVARLQHEHIVTVFEAGRIDGVSFLAMELVAGRSLDELFAEARVERRLVPRAELLRQARDVARALAAAHALGIVHRDVKPSNVRVTPEKKALLVDFGLALDAGSAALSRSDQVHGTIFYVSPEQIAGRKGALDGRTDVWSLGVTLYEGLTGCRPFEGAGSEEVLYRIVTHEPVAPRALAPGLPRDVETVVLKALEKERERRYAGAAQLADDLDALLEGRPIRARPSGAITRAWKWSRRKPAHATSAALALVLLVGGPLALAVLQARHAHALEVERDQARAERRRADAERALAQERAHDLEEVVLFQGDAIGRIQPSAMARQLVDDLRVEVRAAALAEGLDAAAADERARRLDALLSGANTTNVAVEALRVELLEPAVASARERFAARPKAQGMLLHTIAATCWSLGLNDLGLRTQQAAHEVLLGCTPPDDADRLACEANLGYYLFAAGRTREAEPLMRAAAEGLARLHGADDWRALSARHNVAMLLHAAGRSAESEAELRAVLEDRRRALGDDDPDTLTSLASLGGVLLQQERTAEAADLLAEALAGRRRVLGPGDQATLASANNLGVLYRDLGRLDDAVRVFRESYPAARASLGDRHPTTGFLRTGLAEVLQQRGELDEAEALLRESVDLCRETLGPFHENTLHALARLGAVLRRRGALDEAEELLASSYLAAGDALGPTHRALRSLARELARALVARGREAEALELASVQGPALRAEVGADDAGAQGWLGLELHGLAVAGRFDEALAALRAARPARATDELAAAVDELFATWARSGDASGRERALAWWKGER